MHFWRAVRGRDRAWNVARKKPAQNELGWWRDELYITVQTVPADTSIADS